MFDLNNDKPLIILDMANNHMGDVNHGLRIIKEFSFVIKEYPEFQFAMKMQYRNLDTFIHPDYKERLDFKYIKRFTETRLRDDEYKLLKDEMVKQGFITVCTPFDEDSVKLADKDYYDHFDEYGIYGHDFDILKVASCSFTDWSLLERIVLTAKPLILSTAGATIEDMKKVVSFLEHRNKKFALMHCVAEYPTIDIHMELNQIDLLKQYFPNIKIGLSTHEVWCDIEIVRLAVAKGVTLFEKHIGVEHDAYKLNLYSARHDDLDCWLMSLKESLNICGERNKRVIGKTTELFALRRGVFAKRDIKEGGLIKSSDVFYAIPTLENHLTANDISKYKEYYAKNDLFQNKPILFSDVSVFDTREKVYSYIKKIRELVKQSNVAIPYKVDMELSHHYGLDSFGEYGLALFTIVNREYCKKLLVILAGQQHPEQYHKLKEETFHILYGDVLAVINGIKTEYIVGDVVTIHRGDKHIFGSNNGAIIEEISSTHYQNDSYYTDEAIMNNKNRKTKIDYWAEA